MDLSAHQHGAEGGQWIGPRPSRSAIGALLLIGTMGMEITGVQPILLGALAAEGRLSAAQLGWATTAEFLTLALALTLAGAFLKPRRLKTIAAVSALAVIACDLLVFQQSGAGVIVNRAVAGFAEGLLVWLPACMIARSATPALWTGVSLVMQCTAQLAFAALLPPTLMTTYGANGGFAALAVTALVALAAAAFVPSALADLPAAARPGRPDLPPPAGLAALLAVFLVAAFSIGLFAYLAPLADQAHLPPEALGHAVSAALAAQIAGAVAASAASKRLHYYPAFLICLVAYAADIALLATQPGVGGFIFAGALFGFFQVFFMPFQLPLVIEADPSRKSAVLLPGVQLFGAASGPFMCSFFVTNDEARPALAVTGACLLVAFLITTPLHLAHRGRAAPRGTEAGVEA